MHRLRKDNTTLNGSTNPTAPTQAAAKPKWSFGRFFRRKKEIESASSSDDDRKAGFLPTSKPGRAKSKSNKQQKSTSRSNKLIGAGGFEYIVASPPRPALPPARPKPIVDNEFFLPMETIACTEPYYQNQTYFFVSPQQYAPAPDQQPQLYCQIGQLNGSAIVVASSDEEITSYNSSNISKLRSDNGSMIVGQLLPNGQSRRSRAARNERYYKRLSRDGEPSNGQAPMCAQQPLSVHWKTQPVPLAPYQPAPTAVPSQRTFQNSAKRSISYDNHIHLQNAHGGRLQNKPQPPPPPPRVSSHDLRPLSYAFDTCGVPVLPVSGRLNGRCVSDDRIWQPRMPQYQSVRSNCSYQPGKPATPCIVPADYHYVTDAVPRSRKPIHTLDTYVSEPIAVDGVLRTTKSGLAAAQDNTAQCREPCADQSQTPPTAQDIAAMYSEVSKPKRVSQTQNDEADHVVCASLQVHPHAKSSANCVEIRQMSNGCQKANSMPNHYQRRAAQPVTEPPNMPRTTPAQFEELLRRKRTPTPDAVLTRQTGVKTERNRTPTPEAGFARTTAAKFEELLQRRRTPTPESAMGKRNSIKPATELATNEQPKQALLPVTRRKPSNLEEAIDELEAIYKSLGLPPEESQRVTTPSEFDKFALEHAHEYDDEDSPTGEPDPVRDDVVYRNLQLTQVLCKAPDKQPPFGIPLGPIVPAPQTDYLHVEPDSTKRKTNSPDIIKDDLAVRALRKETKDNAEEKLQFVHPSVFGGQQRKQRALRTQSANIYNLIQRSAAKPAGGDIDSYYEMARSVTELNKPETTSDVPDTLELLRRLKAQDLEQNTHSTSVLLSKKLHVPFRHPSQSGAISQLPERLVSESTKALAPVPMPRKTLTPEPQHAEEGNYQQMEAALNKIAQDAQASSLKLTQDLQELRREALITSSRNKSGKLLLSEEAEAQKLAQDLQEIQAVSVAAKRCGKMLLETLPNGHDQRPKAAVHPAAEFHKEEATLIKAIDEVSEAANAVCEKIMSNIDQPKEGQHEQLVPPKRIKQSNPQQIEAIASRCMRQLSKLAEPVPSCNASVARARPNFISTVAEVHRAQAEDELSAMNTSDTLEAIDQIIKDCEAEQARQEQVAAAIRANKSASTFSTSSDCLPNNSLTPPTTDSRRQSSSITSFNPYSSSDYLRSTTSSDHHALSIADGPVRSRSTTSYEVQTSVTNTNKSDHETSSFSNAFSTTPATLSPSPPPLNLTPDQLEPSPPAQYNSSDELAMIFGISERYNQSGRHQSSSGNTNVLGDLDVQLPASASGSASAAASTPASQPSSMSASSSCCCCYTTTHASIVCVEAFTNPNAACCSCAFDKPLIVTANANSNAIANATNPALVYDATETLYSPTNSSSTASPCSSHSYRLETIPELETEDEAKPPSHTDEAGQDQAEADAVEGTRLDSLSSVDESNPDSGNVSLVDYPQGQTKSELKPEHSNNDGELGKAFSPEISISSDEEEQITVLAEPSIPTIVLSMEEDTSAETKDLTEFDFGTLKNRIEGELPLSETPESATSVINDVRADSEVNSMEEPTVEISPENEKTETDELHSTSSTSLTEAITMGNEGAEDSLEELSEIKDESAQAPIEIEANEQSIELNDAELVRPTDSSRRGSLVCEAPALNMFITEVKLETASFEPELQLKLKDANDGTEDRSLDEVDDAAQFVLMKRQHKALNEQSANDDKKSDDNNGGSEDEADDGGDDDDDDNDAGGAKVPEAARAALEVARPRRCVAAVGFGGGARGKTAQGETLSILGEVVPLPLRRRGAGAGDDVDGDGDGDGGRPMPPPITLEHVLFACTLGFIAPNELLVLLTILIVVGMILIFAFCRF